MQREYQQTCKTFLPDVLNTNCTYKETHFYSMKARECGFNRKCIYAK